jgi:hypothetical protein
MNINRNNYEVYMIDYLDGRLDALEVSELLLFMEQNPDIKKEFEQMNEIQVPIVEEAGLDKNKLKKPLYHEVKSQYENKLVARLEGDLTIYEQYELERTFAVYPQLKMDASLYSKTKLHPDLTIVFPQKKYLKRRDIVIPLYAQYAWRVAAVLIAFALIVFLVRTPQQHLNGVAEVSSSVSKQLPATTKKQQKSSPSHQKETSVEKRAVLASSESQTRPFTSTNTSVESHAIMEEVKHVDVKTIEIMPLPSIQNERMLTQREPIAMVIHKQAPYQEAPDKPQEQYKELEQLANEKMSKGVLVEQDKPDSVPEKNTISNMGLLLVKLYNKATGDSAKVVRKYDNDGNITRVTIIADNFEFSRKR